MIHERIYLSEDKTVYLDTYAVNDPRQEIRDAILVIPGGGYQHVCKDREGEPIALAFVARGINAFVLTYSIGENAVYPRQLLDAALAMKHIKENAEKYNITGRIFAVGFSAGGHLLGELTVHHKVAEKMLGLEENYLKLTGSVFCYPVITALDETHTLSFETLLKKPFSEITEEEKVFHSIEAVINSETPPAFIWHTSDDNIVPLNGSLRLALAYKDAKIPVEMHVYPSGPHGLALANRITSNRSESLIVPEAQEWVDKAVRWISEI